MAYNRALNAILQSRSDVNKNQQKAHSEQVERYELVSPDSTNTEKEFFMPNEYEQIHHIVPLRTYDGLFANTNEEQALALAEVLGSGNRIENLFVTPNRVHQAGVHKLMREKGLEINPRGDNPNLHPLIRQMEQSQNLSYNEKLALAQLVRKNLVPQIKEELNEAMSRYGDYEGELQSAGAKLLDLINNNVDTPEAVSRTTDNVQRMAQNILEADKIDKSDITTIKYDTVGPGMTNRKFAGDNDLARAILASMREDSPGDNKERALVVDSGGGDVSIGQGVLRTNGKNGNGNGNGH